MAAYNSKMSYRVTASDATSATLGWTPGDGLRAVTQPPLQVVLTWASAVEKPAGFNVGAAVTIRVQS
jgi:hypothetical protein